ncbi:PhoH family protein [Candidatus Dependentiae bacterium]|nr:MAG: PhoH family protein [Candidatus Dependentiae bacterium]
MVEENKKEKIYVLDTNVIVHDPNAYKNFEGVNIGIPTMVIEELDSFKREGSDRGRNSREFIRQLDELRKRGSLREGVQLDNGSVIRVLFLDHDVPRIPFKLSREDNAILSTVLGLQKAGHEVQFISKDLNARVKADVLGIYAEDYLKDEYVSEDAFYHGWITLDVPAVQLKSEQPDVLADLAKERNLTPNEFVLLQSQHNPHNYRIFRFLEGKRFVSVPQHALKWPLQPRNPQQVMALNLLLDDSIQCVTLLGPAGTGKTFLALLAGLHKVLIEDYYRKLLVSRPVVPLGRDIGYLPGTLEEKLHSWMLPIYDNMEFIAHGINMAKHTRELEQGPQSKKKGKHHKKDKTGFISVDDLVQDDKLSLEAITYMRGRSIPYQYILIDEAQNLTPHEVKTIVTRVGEGSKVVLVGDPYQIDSPYLDFSSNGLVTVSEKLKGHPIFGTVFLSTSERSKLSELAGRLL